MYGALSRVPTPCWVFYSTRALSVYCCAGVCSQYHPFTVVPDIRVSIIYLCLNILDLTVDVACMTSCRTRCAATVGGVLVSCVLFGGECACRGVPTDGKSLLRFLRLVYGALLRILSLLGFIARVRLAFTVVVRVCAASISPVYSSISARINRLLLFEHFGSYRRDLLPSTRMHDYQYLPYKVRSGSGRLVQPISACKSGWQG